MSITDTPIAEGYQLQADPSEPEMFYCLNVTTNETCKFNLNSNGYR